MNYWFDSHDCISKVDDEWHLFAAENGAPALTPDAVRGQHLSRFIADSGTCELWKRLLERAREGARVAVTIRCDAPDCRRTLVLRLRTDRARVRVTSTLVAREYRPAMDLLRTPRNSEGVPLVACAWCRRFELSPGAWVEVEALVNSLNLFEQAVLPPVSHGICPSCDEHVTAQIESRLARG